MTFFLDALRVIFFAALFLFHDPDIAEENRIAVTLKLNRSGICALLLPTSGGTGNLHVIVNEDAVVAHGRDGVLRLLAVGIEARGFKIDIVRLPRERR